MFVIEWTPILTSLFSFLFGGGLITIIAEWRYRRLNKKVKTSKSSSESYLDYEKVIDSNTKRVEKLIEKQDQLYEAIGLSKKMNGILRMKIFEYRQLIHLLNKEYDLESMEEYKSFFDHFNSEKGFDIFDMKNEK